MRRNHKWLAALAGMLVAGAAQAALVLGATRVIYPAGEREVTLRLDNQGSIPLLVQAWLDDGNANAVPDEAKAPFTLTPPLFRLDPSKGQTLRLIHTGEPLPTDRESLFWLNALEVPPVNADTGTNALQLAFRSRIKVFFRPGGLSGDVRDAPAGVTWSFARKPDGRYVVRGDNPTPYHITFSRIEAEAAGKTYRHDAGLMIAPLASGEFDIGTEAPGVDAPAEVRYTSINDYGAAVTDTYRGKP
ncbi:molecular chaperone [Pigmentiphaga sp. H8]|uniref:fimbria/pilus periplasmic chaperone n=1 Tax=Pigmentiphaga sp. H8 TaxID=2488560 RepID=UPI000F592090|nr:fimbria/pilus periplasmic chaperone [Pigmentiphaga sp. H8]AZG06688.1 molecular chaperone [Pigmentiphaga sp. H8]